MDILTLDFETYYSKEYSLRRMTTEEYINDGLFEVIGVSVKKNAEPIQWFTGTSPAVGEWLRQFDWAKSAMVAHNARFDAAILAWRFKLSPKEIFCTMSMARALNGPTQSVSLASLAKLYELGEKGDEVVNVQGMRREDFNSQAMERYAEYCKLDVELTYKLFRHLMVAEEFPKRELKLVSLTTKMYTSPVLELHRERLEDHLAQVKQRKQDLLDGSGMDIKDLRSNSKLAAALKELGVKPPMKISPTTGKPTYAFAKTDEGIQALLDHPNEQVQAIVEARLGVKSSIEESRTERFIGIARRMDRMPVPLNYYAAHTGRWGGGDKINLQNLPSRGPNANHIKRGIVAPAGHVIINGDSSQIEARTLAWLAGQDDLVEAFDKGEDVYVKMASRIYDKPEEEITPSERFMGKIIILGAGYGLGHVRLRKFLAEQGIEVSETEARHLVNVYRTTYPMIPALWRRCQLALDAMWRGRTLQVGRSEVVELCPERMGFKLPSGLWLEYPGMYKRSDSDGREEFVYPTRRGDVRIYGPKVVENLCQALARCVIAEQILLISERYRVILTVHDSTVNVVHELAAHDAVTYIAQCLRTRPAWAPDLPLDCEIEIGRSYGKMKQIEI